MLNRFYGAVAALVIVIFGQGAKAFDITKFNSTQDAGVTKLALKLKQDFSPRKSIVMGQRILTLVETVDHLQEDPMIRSISVMRALEDVLLKDQDFDILRVDFFDKKSAIEIETAMVKNCWQDFWNGLWSECQKAYRDDGAQTLIRNLGLGLLAVAFEVTAPLPNAKIQLIRKLLLIVGYSSIGVSLGKIGYALFVGNCEKAGRHAFWLANDLAATLGGAAIARALHLGGVPPETPTTFSTTPKTTPTIRPRTPEPANSRNFSSGKTTTAPTATANKVTTTTTKIQTSPEPTLQPLASRTIQPLRGTLQREEPLMSYEKPLTGPVEDQNSELATYQTWKVLQEQAESEGKSLGFVLPRVRKVNGQIYKTLVENPSTSSLPSKSRLMFNWLTGKSPQGKTLHPYDTQDWIYALDQYYSEGIEWEYIKSNLSSHFSRDIVSHTPWSKIENILKPLVTQEQLEACRYRYLDIKYMGPRPLVLQRDEPVRADHKSDEEKILRFSDQEPLEISCLRKFLAKELLTLECISTLRPIFKKLKNKCVSLKLTQGLCKRINEFLRRESFWNMFRVIVENKLNEDGTWYEDRGKPILEFSHEDEFEFEGHTFAYEINENTFELFQFVKDGSKELDLEYTVAGDYRHESKTLVLTLYLQVKHPTQQKRMLRSDILLGHEATREVFYYFQTVLGYEVEEVKITLPSQSEYELNDNWDAYQEAIGRGLSPIEAAKETWHGKLLKAMGYSEIKAENIREAPDGSMHITFTKP